MIFVPVRPADLPPHGADTDGTGMPTSKGWEVEVEPSQMRDRNGYSPDTG